MGSDRSARAHRARSGANKCFQNKHTNLPLSLLAVLLGQRIVSKTNIQTPLSLSLLAVLLGQEQAHPEIYLFLSPSLQFDPACGVLIGVIAISLLGFFFSREKVLYVWDASF